MLLSWHTVYLLSRDGSLLALLLMLSTANASHIILSLAVTLWMVEWVHGAFARFFFQYSSVRENYINNKDCEPNSALLQYTSKSCIYCITLAVSDLLRALEVNCMSCWLDGSFGEYFFFSSFLFPTPSQNPDFLWKCYFFWGLFLSSQENKNSVSQSVKRK